jgi:serine/threonine protein kinase
VVDPRPYDEPTVMRRSLVGAVLGDYQVEMPLGEGGMGVVYRATHKVLGKGVAIKVLKDDLVDDEKHAARLLEEARNVARLKHPNIADVYDFGRTPDGHPYFVMELLEGLPLDRLIDDRGAQPLTDCLEIIDQVLGALTAAHAAGLVHRDLKPSNVFLERLSDGTRHVKLLDFGLAKRLDRGKEQKNKRASMVLVGTPDSMAPEQVRGESLGPGTDLWAVGVLLYELCTGVRPFLAAQSIDVLMKVVHEAPLLPSHHDRSLPAGLDELIFKLLDKSLATRPSSATAVRATVARLRREVQKAHTQVGAAPSAQLRPRPLGGPAEQPHAEPTTQMRMTDMAARTDEGDAETELRIVVSPTFGSTPVRAIEKGKVKSHTAVPIPPQPQVEKRTLVLVGAALAVVLGLLLLLVAR